jgi:hypothetical protein
MKFRGDPFRYGLIERVQQHVLCLIEADGATYHSSANARDQPRQDHPLGSAGTSVVSGAKTGSTTATKIARAAYEAAVTASISTGAVPSLAARFAGCPRSQDS